MVGMGYGWVGSRPGGDEGREGACVRVVTLP